MLNFGNVFRAAAALAVAGVVGNLFAEEKAAAVFRPMLVLTVQPSFADMFTRALDGTGVNYAQAGRVFLKQKVHVLVFSAGQALDANGEMNVDFDLEVKRPDGSVERLAGQVVRRGKVPSSEALVFPEAQLSYWEEAAGRTGLHVITARVRDRVAGTEVELKQSLDVAAFEEPALPEGFEKNGWLLSYYTRPSPELALPALEKFFEDLRPQNLEGATAVVLNFYDQVLSDNDWLAPFFAGAYEESAGLRRVGLEFVTGYFLRKTKERPAWCGEVLWEDSAAVREFAWPELSEGAPGSSAELDMLWGRFFATGRFEWVERVASAVEYADLPGEKKGADSLVDLAHEAVLRSALGSLENNARVHLLVRGYAGFLARAGKWPEAQRELIGRAIGMPEEARKGGN